MRNCQVGTPIVLWKLEEGTYEDHLGAQHHAHIVVEEISTRVSEVGIALLVVNAEDGRQFCCNVHQWRATDGNQQWNSWNNGGPQNGTTYAEVLWASRWGSLGYTPCANPDGSRPEVSQEVLVQLISTGVVR